MSCGSEDRKITYNPWRCHTRTLILFGTESRQTDRFKAAEQASCCGKFSSQELLIKTSMLMMPSKMMLRQLLVEHVPFPYGILCGAGEKRQLMYYCYLP